MEAVTTSPKFQLVITAAIRKKYNVKAGYNAIFIPFEGSLRVLSVPTLEQARGIFPDMDTDPQCEKEGKER